MRKITRISLALGASAALLSLSALPASADDVGKDDNGQPVAATVESKATVNVPSGPLSINVAANSAPIDFVFSTSFGEDKDLAVDVPQVTITDWRAGVLGWTVSVAMTDFVLDDETIVAEDKPTINVSKATYNAGLTKEETVGSALFDSNEVTLGDVAKSAVAANSVVGNNTASWNASVTVPVPSDVLAGDYVATLTHSLI